MSGSWDCRVRVWRDGALCQTFEGHSEAVWCVLPLGNGVIASGSADKTIRLWTQGEAVEPIKMGSAVRGLACFCGGFIACGNDGWVRWFSGTAESGEFKPDECRQLGKVSCKCCALAP